MPNKPWMDDFAGSPRLNIHYADHTPSWRRYADGGYAHAEFVFDAHHKTIGLRAVEGYKSRANGRDVSKEVMLTLDPVTARAMHAQLGIMLGVVVVPALKHDAMMLKKYGTKVTPKGRLERRIVANLIAHLAAHGFNVSHVDDGNITDHVADMTTAMEFIFNLDDCHVTFTHKNGSTHWVKLVRGNGCEMVSDWELDENVPAFDEAMTAFDPEQYA